MRYSVAVKFLAVILCAASLLGAAGSAAGMFVLAEQGLYQRTVEEAYRDHLENISYNYASMAASGYASQTLGGADINAVMDRYGYGWHDSYFRMDRMGYTLTDGEGQVLESREMNEDYVPEHTFRFPVAGSYMKVIATYPREETILIDPAVTEVRIMPSQEETRVSQVMLEYTDGHTLSYDTGTDHSVLRLSGGELVLETREIDGIPEGDGWYVTRIWMLDMAGNVAYDAQGGNVLLGYGQEGNLLRVLLPVGQVTQTAPAGTHIVQGEYTAYDAIPEEGITVAGMNVSYTDGGDVAGSEGCSSPGLLGTLFHDYQGNAEFHSTEPMSMDIPEGCMVTAVSFMDRNGNVIFEAACPGGVGVLSNDEKGCLVFRGQMPGTEIPGEEPAEQLPSGVIFCTASEDMPVYALPVAGGETIGILQSGERAAILQTGNIGGANWALIEQGWILLEAAVIQPAAPESRNTAVLTDSAEEAALPEETAGETEPAAHYGETEPAPQSVEETLPETAAAEATAVAETYPRERVQTYTYYDEEQGQTMVAEYVMEALPAGYTVELQLAAGADRNEHDWELIRAVYALRQNLVQILIGCALVWVLSCVYLCCAAARRRGTTAVCAGGLNRIPLDLYLGSAAMAGAGLILLGVEGTGYLMHTSTELGWLFVIGVGFAASLLVVGFGFAFVAQIKTPDGFWWKNMLCVQVCRLLLRLCAWLKDLAVNCFPLLVRFLGWVWTMLMGLVRVALRLALWLWERAKEVLGWTWGWVLTVWDWVKNHFVQFFSLLPLTWQFLLTGFVIVLVLYLMMRTYKVGYILLGFGIFFGVLLYAASAFGILLDSAKRMSHGDLDTKVDDRLLIGCFRDFAVELNELADVAVVAAQKQMKSERMKTELITNVSHDIKTPLTSIINYVDLMEKPHTPEEQAAYLEVLARQSQRLKKLIDDLMEMSKASTGNMAVDISRVNAAETVNQALGEFADKLEKAQLIPVFRHPEKEIEMMADGRLVWRVLSNLLGNAVKYAMPGTRMYLDLMELDGKVVISIKNISREALNVSAEELLERFVRGDASRNTEGSGLGLNIAKSLMELQKGELQLLVDGDLFKVTLIFPGV